MVVPVAKLKKQFLQNSYENEKKIKYLHLSKKIVFVTLPKETCSKRQIINVKQANVSNWAVSFTFNQVSRLSLKVKWSNFVVLQRNTGSQSSAQRARLHWEGIGFESRYRPRLLEVFFKLWLFHSLGGLPTTKQRVPLYPKDKCVTGDCIARLHRWRTCGGPEFGRLGALLLLAIT